MMVNLEYQSDGEMRQEVCVACDSVCSWRGGWQMTELNIEKIHGFRPLRPHCKNEEGDEELENLGVE